MAAINALGGFQLTALLLAPRFLRACPSEVLLLHLHRPTTAAIALSFSPPTNRIFYFFFSSTPVRRVLMCIVYSASTRLMSNAR